MNTGGRGAHRRLSLIAVIATLVVWSLASGPAAADLRVRTVESFMGEESTGDLLLKQSRVRVLLPDGSGQIFYCAADEFVVLTPPEDGRYWQGSIEEFQAAVHAWFDDVLSQIPPEAAAFLGAGGTGAAGVRLTRVGTDTVAGYEATQYLVEYNDGGGWQTYENVWVSADLMREIQREAGRCVTDMLEFQKSLEAALSFFTGSAAAAVFSSPDYAALMASAFPVRTVSQFAVFGMTFESDLVVTEVSNDRIPDELFTVPVGYTRVDDLASVLGLDGF